MPDDEIWPCSFCHHQYKSFNLICTRPCERLALREQKKKNWSVGTGSCFSFAYGPANFGPLCPLPKMGARFYEPVRDALPWLRALRDAQSRDFRVELQSPTHATQLDIDLFLKYKMFCSFDCRWNSRRRAIILRSKYGGCTGSLSKWSTGSTRPAASSASILPVRLDVATDSNWKSKWQPSRAVSASMSIWIPDRTVSRKRCPGWPEDCTGAGPAASGPVSTRFWKRSASSAICATLTTP